MIEGDIKKDIYTIQATGTDNNLSSKICSNFTCYMVICRLNCCGVIKSYKIFVCGMTNRAGLKALQIPNKTKFVKYMGPLSTADRGDTIIFDFLDTQVSLDFTLVSKWVVVSN